MSSNGVWSTPTVTPLTSTKSDPTVYYLAHANTAMLITTQDGYCPHACGRIRINRASSFSSNVWEPDPQYDLPSPPNYLQLWTSTKVGVGYSDGLQLLFKSDDNNGRLRAVRFEGTGIRSGFGGDAWTVPQSGVALIDYPGDANLHGGLLGTSKVYFYPYADGNFNVDLADHDDQSKLAIGLCPGFGDGRACNGEDPNPNQGQQQSFEEIECPPFD